MITSDNFKKKLYNSKKTLDFHTISTLQYCIKLPVVFTFACVLLKKNRKGLCKGSELFTPKCASVVWDCSELKEI